MEGSDSGTPSSSDSVVEDEGVSKVSSQQSKRETLRQSQIKALTEKSSMLSPNDSNRGGAEAVGVSDIAFKSVEIDEGIMREEINYLRNMIWKIQDDIRNEYDFGTILLDCRKFKKSILSHVNDLINHLQNYLRNEFNKKQKEIGSEINQVKGKIEHDAKSIDEVIYLLDYIEDLSNQGERINDIKIIIEELVKKSEYQESL